MRFSGLVIEFPGAPTTGRDSRVREADVCGYPSLGMALRASVGVGTVRFPVGCPGFQGPFPQPVSMDRGPEL